MLRLIPAIAIIMLLGGASHQRNQVWRDEFSLWSDVSAKSPAKASAYTYLGMAYGKAGRYEESLAHLAHAARLAPRDFDARYNLGVYYRERGLYRQALAEFQAANSLQPDLPEPYAGMADVFMGTGVFTQAADMLEKALAVRPGHYAYRFGLGMAYARAGGIDKAERLFLELLRDHPDDSAVLGGLGNISMLNKQHQKALRFYERAVAMSPRDPELYYNMALLYDETGQKARAAEYYGKFIETTHGAYPEAAREAEKRLRLLGAHASTSPRQ